MQDVKSATIHSRSFDEKHLQDHEEALIQILVVNLPMNKSTTCQTIALQEVAPHSKEKKTKNKRLEKYHSHKRASYVMIK
jgi:phage head maturation protease